MQPAWITVGAHNPSDTRADMSEVKKAAAVICVSGNALCCAGLLARQMFDSDYVTETAAETCIALRTNSRAIMPTR
jgi:hypothetical protein